MKTKDVLFVVTSHDELGDTGRPTGFYLSEASHPYREISDAGFVADFVSPKGGEAPFEGVDLDDPFNRWFLNDPIAKKKISNTLRPEEVDAGDYPAIFFVGGHGTVWDFKDNTELQNITRTIWENSGIVAGVCHGSAGMINVKLSDGNYLVDGKRMTAFSNAEEFANETSSVVPFFVSDELAKRGAKLEHADMWEEKVVQDGRLITGQNPASAKTVGRTLVRTLRKLFYQEQLR